MNRIPIEAAADVWNAAAQTGNRPTATVAEHFVIPERTAAHWVRKAREAGLLNPPTKRVPGTNPKLIAVADELGVTVDALREAILRQGGDLRIR